MATSRTSRPRAVCVETLSRESSVVMCVPQTPPRMPLSGGSRAVEARRLHPRDPARTRKMICRHIKRSPFVIYPVGPPLARAPWSPTHPSLSPQRAPRHVESGLWNLGRVSEGLPRTQREAPTLPLAAQCGGSVESRRSGTVGGERHATESADGLSGRPAIWPPTRKHGRR
jgi:hypothetical protein